MDIAVLIGKTIVEIQGSAGDDTMRFVCAGGDKFLMYHSQDCCESVAIEDIVGDLKDLIGLPILRAEEATSGERPADIAEPDYTPESETWTFYKLATIKGWVDIRWHGTSNGYYSESVHFEQDAA